ncbi:MAG: type IV pilus twitching motility protein PilT [Armatimonadota bacterium]|nr:type IV pilus twitching motility protein PilT [Armatimonadota bacterium]MDR7421126.1 type IV pilus twitching motility protein PilT [Armatimonadota bacterium]MDR7455595.1 type IV pilus twitching motility protein PilT [Armatimonadota bacterium]MDR7457472.1 type IV pilus twitching motility protein PilT [Armatimonadota bacterium]MDR7496128.1 type IV pilus twitching motility protein PilT [Armatimonadota bacterium]
MMTMEHLLRMVVERRASDLHIKAGTRAMLRVDGRLVAATEDRLPDERVRALLAEILSPEHLERFHRDLELDLAYSLPGVSRFRVNVYQQRGGVGAAIRTIPATVPTVETLGLPPVVKRLASLPRGLVLVTGPTGSGKSTTLAAIVDHINHTRSCHVVTIEDPIEYLHQDDLSIITQREVGADTHSFADALRHVLRQDPDVILVGEMRDHETIATAITAAETGHLVLATLHTVSAAQTVDRIIDVFPPHQQPQVRMQLSVALEGVLSQTLLPRQEGKGRIAAVEIMVGTPAVRNLIREGKTHQLPSIIQSSAKEGMQSLNQALRQLVRERRVSFEDALAHTSNPAELAQFCGREAASAAAL